MARSIKAWQVEGMRELLVLIRDHVASLPEDIVAKIDAMLRE
jgi:hypothetical protein